MQARLVWKMRQEVVQHLVPLNNYSLLDGHLLHCAALLLQVQHAVQVDHLNTEFMLSWSRNTSRSRST